MQDFRVLLILLVGALGYPTNLAPEEPHDSMVGADPRPGTEALHPQTDEMRVVECDDDPPVVWPSPDPIPSTSPKPFRLPAVTANFTLSNETVVPNAVKQPQAPVCEDDDQFEDSIHRKCGDYTMNKEECIEADRYANRNGQTARHACCKCGGGKHVLPFITSLKPRCSRVSMGKDCEEEEMVASQSDRDKMALPEAHLDKLPGTYYTPQQDIVAEDQLEDDQLENLGTLTSMDGILEPDSVVFRNRNFIGYPREPESVPEHITFEGDLNPYNQYSTSQYVVKPHETFDSIARYFHIPTSLLVSFNEDVADPFLLKAGDMILIPEPRVIEVARVSPLQSPLEGGVDVVISGRGFVYPSYCKFGDMVSQATHVVENTIVCPSPGQTDPGVYHLSISDGKGGFENTNFTVEYTVGLVPFCDEAGARPSWCRPRIGIYSVVPLRIPQNTATDITIFGTGFNSSTLCRIGGDLVDSTVVSRTNVTCHFPGKDPSVNSIVLHQGNFSAITQYEIVVYSTLTVSDIEPKYAPDSAATEVTLTGTTFRPGAVCRFNSIIVPTKVISDTRLTCVAPPHEAGVVSIHVSNTGNLFSPYPVEFEYTHVHLFNLSSYAGSFKGGDNVTLTGDGFYPGMFCRFGTIVFRAQYISRTRARCRVPAQSTARVVRVQVSLDGIKEFSDEVHEFRYFAAITEVRPSIGREIGGDDIRVFGTNFDQHKSYSCRFGLIAVPAVVVTTSQIQCFSPAGSGVVDFSLESVDFQYRKNALGEFLTFKYVSSAELGVFHVTPSFTEVRVANTAVRLIGVDFVPGMLCRFGDRPSESRFLSDQAVICTAPLRELAEVVDVTVSRDGGNTWSARLAQFEYRAVVESIDPVLGPVRGGNEIIVKGYGFNSEVSLCVFGNRLSPAVVESQNELKCVAPASEAAAKVPFAVTSNNTALQDHYLEFTFTRPGSSDWNIFYLYSHNPDFIVKSLEPESGSIFGGEVLLVHGGGFDETSHCMFGDRTVKADFVDAQTLRCKTPTHPVGSVTFQVVNFNQLTGYNSSSLSSTYSFVAPTISGLEPSEGTVDGGETIRVTGAFLTGAATCKFGELTTPVVAASAVEVTCKSPPSNVSTIVRFELGYDGEGSSETGTKFTYHPLITDVSPHTGLILTSAQIITFTGKGFAGDPTLCVFEDKFFVPATVRSNTEIDCNVPPSTQPHSASVKLTNSERLITLGKKTFDFLYQPKVSIMFPDFGPTTGETTIVLVGAGISSTTTTHCSFDGELVQAEVVSDVMVRCVSPQHTSGKVQVSLTAPESEQKFVSNSVEFLYRVITTHVTDLFPTFGSAAGGTLVTIRGSGFAPGAFCKFGDKETPAIFHAKDHVTCTAPAVTSDQTVTVEVSQSRGGTGFSADGKTFTYSQSIGTVNRIDPAFGEAGDTIDIFGDGFQRSSVCFIGSRRAAKTTFVNRNHLTCEIPRIGSKPSEVVQVTSDFSFLVGGRVLFHYEPESGDESTVAVREISPNRGPITGGTKITVTGVNFPTSVLCQFGDLRVSAVFVSSNEVSCLSPPHPIAGPVNLEIVTRNRRIFSSSLIPFTYVETSSTPQNGITDLAAKGNPVLRQLTPAAGRAQDVISLTGQSFSSVGFCIFQENDASIPVEADVIDSTHVTCVAPKLPENMGPNVLVKYLSVGGAVSTSLEFKYLIE